MLSIGEWLIIALLPSAAVLLRFLFYKEDELAGHTVFGILFVSLLLVAFLGGGVAFASGIDYYVESDSIIRYPILDIVIGIGSLGNLFSMFS